jgi:predicted transcriptional regulator
MARLIDIMPHVAKPVAELKREPEPEQAKVAAGTKRRAWLQEDEQNLKGVYKPDSSTPIQKGSMKGVDQSGSSTPLHKGLINTVHQPLINSLADLRSNPLTLIHFFFAITGEPDEYSTRRVTMKEIMESLSMSKDSARTALRFLLKNELIERLEFKEGRLGWSRYKIKESLRNEIAQKGSIDHIKKGSKVSSSLLNTTTDYIDTLSRDWSTVDTEALEHIGFSRNHLLQLQSKTTPEIVQHSINHFAYALNHNPKAKEYKNPLAMFIAVLKRGDVWIEGAYRSPEELAMEKILESKKQEIERQKQMEEECFTIASREWAATLTDEQRAEIAPKGTKDLSPEPVKLSVYFRKHHWPEVRKGFGV